MRPHRLWHAVHIFARHRNDDRDGTRRPVHAASGSGRFDARRPDDARRYIDEISEQWIALYCA
jgi:hypothetical protein